MPEVTAAQAGEIIGVTDDTIRNYIERHLLPARRQGLKRTVFIELDTLERFAKQYEFRFDRAVAEQIIGQ